MARVWHASGIHTGDWVAVGALTMRGESWVKGAAQEGLAGSWMPQRRLKMTISQAIALSKFSDGGLSAAARRQRFGTKAGAASVP